jgi:predicted ATPase/DNA-binding SARP family transcriptional activator
MRFEVLGPVRVWTDDGVIVPLPPRPRALLAALLAAGRQTVSAERLVAELWPEGAPPTAVAALQVHASALRKVVGDRLVFTAGGYLLRADEVDALEFEATGDLTLWRGPAFEGADRGPIVGEAAARLSERRLAAQRGWIDRQLADGRPVLAELSGWVAAEPTAEPLVERLMLALHRDGRSAEALDVFAGTVAALAAYETEPSAALTALAEAIRRRDPTLERPGPGLPASRSRFIGRRAELDRAIELSGGTRLLTVVGPGGCGKTRFAYELAREVAAEHDAVHVVELAGYTSGDGLLAVRFAAAAGVREEPGISAVEALAKHLGTQRALFVVDNCEHVRAEAATVLDELLGAVPGVRVVATSREPLSVPGEVRFPLAGLIAADAARLFADRVSAARGGAGLRPEERDRAVELCRRLDGLPLALELAAARLRALPIADIVTRLDRRLDLLVGSSPVERHRTMRAAIDWGYELLDEPQRQLLARLSLFAGGFDLDAASRVADADALDPLSQLTDRSMVNWDGARYRLIETIREYAAERLAADDPARSRFVALWAERVSVPPPADGSANLAWLAEMEAAHDNVLAALEWSLSLRIAASMWWFWWVSGRMAEGRIWLRRALAADQGGPSALRGRALRAAAALARNNGDLLDARRLGEESLATFRRLDDGPGVVAALNNLMITAHGQADHEASLSFGYEALALAEAAGDDRMVAAALNNTAGTLRSLDRLDEAAPLFERALDAFRTLGDARGEAAALNNLGILARRRGEFAASGDYVRSALDRYVELGMTEGQLDVIESLAELDVLDGRPEPGLVRLAVAERERAALGSPLFSPDEIRDRDDAERRARDALTAEEVARAYRTASQTSWAATIADAGRGV